MFENNDGVIWDFGGGVTARVGKDGQVYGHSDAPPAPPPLPPVTPPRTMTTAPPPDASKELPDLAVGDMWYGLAVLLLVCFLFSRSTRAAK